MYPLVRIDKRIPDGSIWQTRRGYRLNDHEGWARVLHPAGTGWANRLGGWTQEHAGLTAFHRERAFVISCYGAESAKHFYVDVARRPTIEDDVIEFVDLFLDVLIGPGGDVTEKDEEQLVALSPAEASFARRVRDEIRGLIAANDALFDPRGAYYSIPADAAALPPAGLPATGA
ncbi:MAG TPA: DUF402 domain-containing protein [Candidatus Limnocylindria bacterium]